LIGDSPNWILRCLQGQPAPPPRPLPLSGGRARRPRWSRDRARARRARGLLGTGRRAPLVAPVGEPRHDRRRLGSGCGSPHRVHHSAERRQSTGPLVGRRSRRDACRCPASSRCWRGPVGLTDFTTPRLAVPDEADAEVAQRAQGHPAEPGRTNRRAPGAVGERGAADRVAELGGDDDVLCRPGGEGIRQSVDDDQGAWATRADACVSGGAR
jgi:hypothetical protein